MCPGDFHDTDAFPKAGSQQPTLIKGQTNRIIIYRGCFSPPHLGHLRILTHAFLRGGRDLNAIAAIVFPVDGKGRPATVKSSLKTLTFTKTERVALWKHDERTPAWAWVYGGSEEELESVMCCLPLLAGKEGYQLEFIALVGPDRAAWKEDPWTPYVGAMTFQDKYGEWIGINCKGCETTLICDAAREATEFDINGRLKRFKGCTPWGLLRLDIDVLKEAEKLKSEAFIATLEVKKPNKWKGVVGDTGTSLGLKTT